MNVKGVGFLYHLEEKEKQEILQEMIQIRRNIHEDPELSTQEHKTSKYIQSILQSMEIQEHILCDTGVVGLLEGEKSGKTLGIRADIDALSIQEKNDVSYISKNPGVMHACGHDGHAAMALGAARILKKWKKNIKGNIKFLFQPAEEQYGGAKRMIQAGALQNPAVDGIIALHLWPDLLKGTIGSKEGAIMASNDKIKIRIKGKSGHGAMPQTGIDALSVAITFYQAVQQFQAREINPLAPAVITFGMLTAGTSYNIIPNEAVLQGTIRTTDEVIRDQIERRLEQILKSICEMVGATYEWDYIRQYPVTNNHGDIVNRGKQSASMVFEKDKILTLDHPYMTAEDFSYFLQEIPGAMFFIGTKEEKYAYPLHHEKFNFDEKILLDGALFLAITAVQFLES